MEGQNKCWSSREQLTVASATLSISPFFPFFLCHFDCKLFQTTTPSQNIYIQCQLRLLEQQEAALLKPPCAATYIGRP